MATKKGVRLRVVGRAEEVLAIKGDKRGGYLMTLDIKAGLKGEHFVGTRAFSRAAW